jgi:3-isopropylmalate/(R)-2-methylmalate dehydratase small subunit
MEPFKTHQGQVAPLDRSNVDTDAIVPKQFLKRIEQSGFGQFLFYDWRFNESGEKKQDFVLNDPNYENASILLAKENFGSGSSREHAPWALVDYGFKVIIACSYADIFYNNSFKNGLLLITQPAEVVEDLFEKAAAKTQLTINLVEQTIITEDGKERSFDIDPYHRKMLLEGLDEIGMTIKKEDQIKQFEERRAGWLTPAVG